MKPAATQEPSPDVLVAAKDAFRHRLLEDLRPEISPMPPARLLKESAGWGRTRRRRSARCPGRPAGSRRSLPASGSTSRPRHHRPADERQGEDDAGERQAEDGGKRQAAPFPAVELQEHPEDGDDRDGGSTLEGQP